MSACVIRKQGSHRLSCVVKSKYKHVDLRLGEKISKQACDERELGKGGIDVHRLQKMAKELEKCSKKIVRQYKNKHNEKRGIYQKLLW